MWVDQQSLKWLPDLLSKVTPRLEVRYTVNRIIFLSDRQNWSNKEHLWYKHNFSFDRMNGHAVATGPVL